MITIDQPPMLTAAYAAGVLMFFAPCSVGLLPAYLTYYLTHDSIHPDDGPPASSMEESTVRTTPSSLLRSFARQLLLANGILVFLMGAIPLFTWRPQGFDCYCPAIVSLFHSQSSAREAIFHQ